MPGTTSIRQNGQNSQLSTYGLNIARIIGNPRQSTAAYYAILGAGPQQNRVYNYYKRNGYLISRFGI